MSHRRFRPLAALVAFVVALVWLPLLAGPASAAGPVLVPDTTINGCNGVLPTPGSENTHKRLDPSFPSDFNPGGVVGYIVDFPVSAADVGGDFEITDCVYVDPPGGGTDAPIAKYFVHFVPNAEDFHLQFAVPIPANTPLGSQFCNYVKTTASPSASQASNRKAGPACFTVGGGLRIEKRTGSTTGPLLPGASFSVVCSPTTTQPPTIITGLSNQSHTNANGTVSATGVADDGTIAINGPSGTPCVVTETAAPAGYLLDATPRNLVIPVGASQTINVFVNHQQGSLTVTKHAVGAGGTFHFTVSCDDGETYAPFDLTVAAGATGSHLVSDAIVVGTECTVAETANALFSTTSSPVDGTVTIDADGETVAFTNTRLTGSLVVTKTSNEDGTFHFDVDCDGTAYDTTLDITTASGAGDARIDGIPTGTSCTVSEQSNPLFSSVVVPAGGTVTIATGDTTVAFANTRLTGSLVITKSADVNGTFTFDVECTGTAYDATGVTITTTGGSGSYTIPSVPTGTVCTVTERSDAHWTTQVVPADGTVTIATGDNTVAFTNTRVRGALSITKSSDVDGTFTFDVDCSDDAYDASNVSITTGGSGSASISGIPTGVTCTVTEDADPHFTVTVVPADGTVTIDANGETVAFSNVRVRGSLVVTKAIVDESPNAGLAAFTFHVTCDGTALPDFELGTQAGLALSKTIEGIPTDQVCTVTEDHDPTWSTVVTPTGGTATIGTEPVTVAFTNTRQFTDTSITKSADPVSGTAVTDGDTIEYTVHYANDGNVADEITITDAIPAGTTYVDGSASDGGTLAGGTLSWHLTAGPGTSGDVSFSVTVDDALPDPTTVVNQAVLEQVGPKITRSNKTEHPVAHVKVVKSVDKTSAAYGDVLLYTLSVTNPSAADLTGVVVTDPLPKGVTFVGASNGGTCDSPCTTITWPARSLAAGGAFDVTFQARIVRPAAAADGAIPAGVIENSGAVDSTETPKVPSNKVVTKVTAVEGTKFIKPPVLPQTGGPISDAVALALGLLLAGAGLTFGTSWRARLAKAAGEE
ncbi:MAG TPA: DUF5979 domain-containing protein [Mycobacteriales bacterium]|jgi:uncharacterized repeat protein (TIGR01451 family)/LPXTG-motif cell wall-anchored protein|nr:DUF5979 domain-containing protein [Mycobacteriales bacterium]